MIENFTPQPYPIWIVTEDITGGLSPARPELVVGWRGNTDGSFAPVVLNDTGDATAIRPRPGEAVFHPFADWTEACAFRDALASTRTEESL